MNGGPGDVVTDGDGRVQDEARRLGMGAVVQNVSAEHRTIREDDFDILDGADASDEDSDEEGGPLQRRRFTSRQIREGDDEAKQEEEELDEVVGGRGPFAMEAVDGQSARLDCAGELFGDPDGGADRDGEESPGLGGATPAEMPMVARPERMVRKAGPRTSRRRRGSGLSKRR